MDDRDALEAFCREFAAVDGAKVLVHGGGVMAGRLQEALGIPVVKIEGRRVTDERTLEVVTMVYAGLCNKTIVALLQKYGCNAIGLSGADGSCVKALKRPPLGVDAQTIPSGMASEVVPGDPGRRMVDFGLVGDVTPESVNAAFLKMLVEQGLTPVLCAVNHDGAGQLLNTNADTVASSVASALGAELDIVFEKAGVLEDIGDPGSVIPLITPRSFEDLKAAGKIADGMIPKIRNAFAALEAGCPEVRIGRTRVVLE